MPLQIWEQQLSMQLEETNTLLKVLVRLAFEGNEKYPRDSEKIELLDKLKVGNSEIAEILGTTPEYVAVAKNRIKKRKKTDASTQAEKNPHTSI
jgi:hypothetical protein